MPVWPVVLVASLAVPGIIGLVLYEFFAIHTHRKDR